MDVVGRGMNIFYCNNKNPFRNVKTRSILYTSVADLGEGPTHPLLWIKKKKSQEKSLQGKQNNPNPPLPSPPTTTTSRLSLNYVR